jgi:hypothetical protein
MIGGHDDERPIGEAARVEYAAQLLVGDAQHVLQDATLASNLARRVFVLRVSRC